MNYFEKASVFAFVFFIYPQQLRSGTKQALLLYLLVLWIHKPHFFKVLL